MTIDILSLHQSKIIKTDGRLRLAMITVWSLFVIALLNGGLYYSQQNKVRQEAQKATYGQWVNQPKKNPHSAAHYGFYAYKPLSVMTVMDKGLEDYLGSAIWLEAHNQNEVKIRPIQDATFLARFGDITVGFVWQFLFPLLVILFAFNTITSEREQATLKMLLVSGVSKYDIVRAKFWSVYQIVMKLFIPTFLALNVVMMILNSTNYVSLIPHLLVLLIFQSLYLAFFTVIGVSVSALSKRSGYALFNLLCLWILVSFLIPRFNGLIANKVFPTQTAFSFWKEMKKESNIGAKERNEALEKEYLTKYKVDSIQHLPINFVGIQLQDGEKHGDEIHEKFYGNLNNTLEKQDKVIELGAIISPVTAMRNISMALAGTDSDKQKTFEAQSETHRRMIQKTMNEAIVEAPKDEKGAIPMTETSLWEKVPQFQYQELNIMQVLGNQWLNLVVLLSWSLIGWYFLKNISKKIVV